MTLELKHRRVNNLNFQGIFYFLKVETSYACYKYLPTISMLVSSLCTDYSYTVLQIFYGHECTRVVPGKILKKAHSELQFERNIIFQLVINLLLFLPVNGPLA